jgi:hypothetical protein
MYVDTTAIATVIFILISVGVIGYILYRYRNEQSVFKEVALRLGARPDSAVRSDRYVINKNGTQYWYQYTPASRNSPSILTVSAPCLSHGEFTVEPEGKLDKVAKNMGFSSELQTGDSDFDSNYYILSDSVDFARVYFQSAQKREAVKNLFRAGFNKIKYNGKSIVVTWTGFDKSGFSDALITETIAQLAKLSENIPDYFADQEFLGIPRLRIKAIILHLFPCLVGVAAVVSLFWSLPYQPLDGFDIFVRSLLFSVPATVLYLIFTGSMIQGRAAAHKDLIRIAIITLISFLLFTNNVFIIVNGVKDSNPAAFHTVKAVNKYWTRHKSSTTYYVVVRSWRPGHYTEKFTVGAKTYQLIRQDITEAGIISKPGALGFERVVSMKFKY